MFMSAALLDWLYCCWLSDVGMLYLVEVFLTASSSKYSFGVVAVSETLEDVSLLQFVLVLCVTCNECAEED